jgi:hypothetical protein
MIIWAIDPGPKESAFLIWDGSVIHSKAIDDNESILHYMGLPDHNRDIQLAVEWIEAMGMAVGKEVFETCLWVGRFVQAYGGPFKLVGRKSGVKMHLCQSTRATDANIRQALIDRFGPVGTKKAPGLLYGLKSHLWAAFAVAVTAFDQQEFSGG